MNVLFANPSAVVHAALGGAWRCRTLGRALGGSLGPHWEFVSGKRKLTKQNENEGFNVNKHV